MILSRIKNVFVRKNEKFSVSMERRTSDGRWAEAFSNLARSYLAIKIGASGDLDCVRKLREIIHEILKVKKNYQNLMISFSKFNISTGQKGRLFQMGYLCIYGR